ncbi:MAG: SDR family oxidoreductase [Nocardia sp.]|nr:SDR family oxidoreductase [Nocardia sp.]
MILDKFRLDGRVAVVTGAGRGIGAAAAIALAEAGADVAIAARTQSQLDEVAEKIRTTGRKALTVAGDLSDLSAVAGLADAAATEFGRIDIVVNNVGGTMPNTFLTTSSDFLEEAFRFNVSTAHALTQAAVPHMLDGGVGSVVNISSMMGREPGRGFLAYGTAKAALAHWTRLAASDLAPKIRVNAICVGSVLTSALDVVAQNPEVKAKMEAATPMHRLGDPTDIAAGIVYLCSPAGSYLTGKVLEIDGGLIAPNLELGLPDL